MKVLHVLNHSFPHVDGYSVRSAQVVRIQRESGLSPVVLTSPRQEGASPVSFERIDGVPHYRTPPAAGGLHGGQLLYRRMAEVIRDERPQLIHAHTPSLWALPAAAAARRHRLPFVYEVRSCWENAAVDSGKTSVHSPRYRLTRGLETWVMRRAGAILPISEGLASEIAARGIPRSKLFLVPNGVDAQRFCPRPRDAALAAQIGLGAGDLTIGFVGSMLASEGVEELVQATVSISRRVANVHLVLVGTGPRLENVRAIQRRLTNPECVHIVGSVPVDEVERYYSLFDVVVYPRRSSRNNDMVTPLKTLEAMAMEKAVLVSDVGGLRELVDESVGVTFRAGDIEHLAEQCVALLSDPARRAHLGRAARRRVMETRSWSGLIAIYCRAYSAAGCGC